MGASGINFTGLNRSVSDYSGTGACEELINLRPTPTGLLPVKRLNPKMTDITYDRVLTHGVEGTVNYISLSLVNNTLYAYHISEDGTTQLQTLFSLSVPASFSVSNVYTASTGNIILFSICDTTASVYSNYTFRWDGDSYVEMSADVPDVHCMVSMGTPELFSYEGQTIDNTDKADIKNKVNIGQSAIQELNPDYCFGGTIAAIAFKTTGGQTFWTGKWFYLSPLSVIRNTWTSQDATVNYFRVFDGHEWANYFADLLPTANSVAYVLVRVDGKTIRLAGVPITLTMQQITGMEDIDNSIIQSVEVYTSRPKLYCNEEDEYQVQSGGTRIAFAEKSVSAMDLGGELLYLQKSIPLKELVNGNVSVELKFGGNIQTTNKTLEVDPGMVTRSGKVLAYNSRYHFYDSSKETNIVVPDFGGLTAIGQQTYFVFIRYRTDQTDSLVYVGTESIPIWSQDVFVIAPTLNIKEVIAYRVSGTDVTIKRYNMTESSAYNYSFNDSGPYSTESVTTSDTAYTELLALTSDLVTSFRESETGAINVSEQYNPYVFRVEHSYLAPSKVLDLQPQMVAVTDVSFGDYPLNVFTQKGVYALLQGSGNVLYGAFRPVSNLISTSNSAVTDMGTFFLAAGGLWNIAGSRATLISEALLPRPHTFIRNCPGYQGLCNATAFYDIAEYESQVDFETYTQGATLSYNRFQDEIIVSNPSYSYSYVVNLKYRQWHKIGYTLSQASVGANIARMETGIGTTATPGTNTTLNLVDITINFGWGTIYITLYLERTGQQDIVMEISKVYTDEDVFDYEEAQSELVALWNENYGSIVTATAGEYVEGEKAEITLTFSTMVSNVSYIHANAHSVNHESTEEWAALTVSSPGYSIVDFYDEDEDSDVLVHLQSRPISFGYQYSHVHRMVSMIRTALSSSNKLITALYGSDDLQNWTLISYALRSDVTLSQVRTGSAGRSWRYYTITIGGNIPLDTDFGGSLLDVEPVIRRIG